MTDKQENKLSMYYAVQKLVDNFGTVWATNTPFVTVYNLFKAKLPLLETKRNIQLLENTGAAVEKTQKKEELANKAFYIANRIQSYALAVNNQDLFATVNYTPTKISRARDTDLAGIAKNIQDKATANAAALVPYGVTAALTTDLGTVLAAYTALLSKPRVSKVTTKAATEALDVLISETDEILDQRLDREIVFYTTVNPEFYKQYLQSRKIINTAQSKLAISGNITDDDTSEPIKGIQLEFTNVFEGSKMAADAKELKFKKKTTVKGNFQVQNLAAGTYQVTVSKLGYVTQVLKVNVIEKETAKLNVTLVKA